MVATAVVGCALGLAFAGEALAQARLGDASVVSSPSSGLLGRFKASALQLTTYLGTGTFVRGTYADNPYVSEELVFYPRFRLGQGFDLRAQWALDCELTQPDNRSGRHCAPSDLRLSLHRPELYRDPWLKGQLSAAFLVYLPTSSESRFNHTVMNLRARAGYTLRFFRERLELAYGFGVQKYLPTQRVRGYGPDSGPRTSSDNLPLVLSRSSAGTEGSVGSGGALNDNWLFVNSVNVAFHFSPRWSAALDFGLYNYVRFSVADAFSDPEKLRTGRADWTSGSLEVAYRPLDRVVVAAGVASLQPALTADGKSVRFPFYDFISPTSNFTKWHLTATVTY